eukprot:m.8360 g.8360  ORF g.8360 m.8360 type:complete len:695 (+) comp20534_c0_seq1:40-2124(+)
MTSWWSDLAGKAEAFLDSVDQSAADKLQTPRHPSTKSHANSMSASFSIEPKDQWENYSEYAANFPRVPSENVLSKTMESNRDDVVLTKPLTASLPAALTRSKLPATNLSEPETTDEQLLAFLNAPKAEKTTPANATVTVTVTAPRTETDEQDGGEETKGRVNSGESVTVSQNAGRDPSAALRDKISNLELENRLLKREVTSLNEELSATAERNRHIHDELVGARKELEPSRQRASKTDRLMRDLQSQHDDLTATLAAKDSQLAVLKVRLQEADQKVESYHQSLDSLKVENERVVQDHSDSSGVQHQVLEELRQRLEYTETLLGAEREKLSSAQVEALERQTQWDVERQQMGESLSDIQRKLAEEKRRVTEFSQSLKSAKSDLDQTRKELSDYKEKAQRILQSKDKLITELKSGGETADKSGSTVNAELEQMGEERDLLRDEAQGTQIQLEHLRSEIQEMERHQQSEADHSLTRIQELEDSLEEEKRQREVAEQEAARRLQEIEFTQTELFKQKSAIHVQLQGREEEIKTLRRQMTARSVLTTSQTELEARIRSLTESLIQKQTAVETLTTEKTSLSLQLDRTQGELKKARVEVEADSHKSGGSTIITGFKDDENARMRPISSMLSSEYANAEEETQIRKGVRKAANSLDKFSVQLGRFLRRYPIARVLVIFYMILLHVWVMIVLLTYQPEAHSL